MRAVAIMGVVECEHSVRGRDLSEADPANDLYHEQNDGIPNVYSGA